MSGAGGIAHPLKLLLLVCYFLCFGSMQKGQHVEAFPLNINSLSGKRPMLREGTFAMTKYSSMQDYVENEMRDFFDAAAVCKTKKIEESAGVSQTTKMLPFSITCTSASMLVATMMMIPSSPAMAAAEASSSNSGMPPFVEEGVKWIFVGG